MTPLKTLKELSHESLIHAQNFKKAVTHYCDTMPKHLDAVHKEILEFQKTVKENKKL